MSEVKISSILEVKQFFRTSGCCYGFIDQFCDWWTQLSGMNCLIAGVWLLPTIQLVKNQAANAPITFEETVMVIVGAVISPFVLLIGGKRITCHGSNLNKSLGKQCTWSSHAFKFLSRAVQQNTYLIHTGQKRVNITKVSRKQISLFLFGPVNNSLSFSNVVKNRVTNLVIYQRNHLNKEQFISNISL